MGALLRGIGPRSIRSPRFWLFRFASEEAFGSFVTLWGDLFMQRTEDRNHPEPSLASEEDTFGVLDWNEVHGRSYTTRV